MTSISTSTLPTITRSTLINTTFTDLTPSDTITRSDLRDVTITCSGSRTPTTLLRSALTSCTVTHSSTSRSNLKHTTLTNASVSRTEATHASFGIYAYSHRSILSNVILRDRSSVKRSHVKDACLMGGSSLWRSNVTKCMIADESRVQRCKLVDCDVVCCVLVKTDFEGMVVRNGVWKDGVLVGKVREGEEVVVLKKGDIREMKIPVNEKKLDSKDTKYWLEEESSEGEGEREMSPPPAYTA
ncbi:hypothetical protein CBS63078_8611 [Aspergillus niger]|uniref:Uncharacterized protein n=1 Tax=Aspergillus niger (strain ATCC 1015 / CBS 113.46 / FGSC A1144 / LSHB Ac4 / NCTC 3858a / NRRL 328 / USDA 3528.7) TaxID=380704 RepID=G3XY59_ASPNA|nr:hypothetical protein ANI_1_1406134 [Aspergillus niger CBS 513.88]EHA24689.1 hypothetical protein ASPNIDRAFT_40588 [Aspergillus niger ATCC 1015]KAI2819942.1 hypothetical protein CBS115989_4079 [Aspergillus niger]KAI2843037.1 hypothetical protein CBS11232_8397 [Aspergillus niger]KAI2849509.1 hypothetical protein CBS11350_2051 [Aspergillus niger]KAI2873114.1 hypothetical protein CBS115988_7252 [Aspergillus niger]|eukprot:XP_001396925.2 hypothetical protein ANI_1_1406134 [Aspergillus niger CBS 513.88]